MSQLSSGQCGIPQAPFIDLSQVQSDKIDQTLLDLNQALRYYSPFFEPLHAFWA